MQNSLLIAILGGLGGMIGWGAADFFAKKTLDHISPLKSLVWAHVCGSLFFVAAAIGQYMISGHGIAMPEGSAWLGLVGFGVLQMVVYWLVYIGFEKGQLSILNPVFASFTGVVALVAIIFFKEHTSALVLIALAVLFSGILMLNIDIKGFRVKKFAMVPGLKEVGAATVLAAIWTLGWGKFINGHDALSYALWMYVFMTLAACVLAKMAHEKLLGVPGQVRKFVVLIGLGEAVAYLTISWAYGLSNLIGVIALVSGAFSVPTVILAAIFLKERVTRLQLLAIVVIILAIGAVSLG